MPNPGDVILIPNCPCCGSSSSSVSSTSSAGTSSSSSDCSCCCSFFVDGIESGCGNCIISRTSRSPQNDPCYSQCLKDAKLITSLTITHGATSENCNGDTTNCTKWYNHGAIPPFQTSAILLNNLFTFFYVRSTSPLCIYTAIGVPCVDGQLFTWLVSAPGTGCPAPLMGSVSW